MARFVPVTWSGSSTRAQAYVVRDGGKLLHMNRIHYSLDGEIGVRRPLGMAGQRLTCQYHAVTGDPASLRNIEGLIERCYLSVAGFVPSGLASALAATTADEQQFGVACLDIGAGATKVAVIADGRFLHVDTIAVWWCISDSRHRGNGFRRLLQRPSESRRFAVQSCVRVRMRTSAYPIGVPTKVALSRTNPSRENSKKRRVQSCLVSWLPEPGTSLSW